MLVNGAVGGQGATGGGVEHRGLAAAVRGSCDGGGGGGTAAAMVLPLMEMLLTGRSKN